jgi:hypothetical protein
MNDEPLGVPKKRAFEDYKHDNSRRLIEGLRRAANNPRLLWRDRDFALSVSTRYVYDYELSEKQKYVAMKILSKRW